MTIKALIAKLSLSTFLLLVVLGTTPRVYLHQLFAHHTDQISRAHVHPGTPYLQHQGFNCNIFDLVVNDSYLAPLPFFFAFSLGSYPFHSAPSCSGLSLQDAFETAGRSPPGHV